MANTIELAKNYLADPQNLNDVFVADSQFGELMIQRFEAVGANTILLPINTYGVTEIPDYSRAVGYDKVDIDRKWDTYTLTQDWGMQLGVDAMDIEESKAEGIIAFANDATRKLTIPRADKYIAKKLVDNAGTTVQATITKVNVLDEIDNATVVFENEGVVGNLHLFVTPEVYKAIKNADGFTRTLDVKDPRTGVVREVNYIDDIEVHVVKGKRLPVGTNFILLTEEAVFGIIKHNPSYYFAAGTYPGKDSDVADLRLYFDFFVFENKKIGIYVNEEA